MHELVMRFYRISFAENDYRKCRKWPYYSRNWMDHYAAFWCVQKTMDWTVGCPVISWFIERILAYFGGGRGKEKCKK